MAGSSLKRIQYRQGKISELERLANRKARAIISSVNAEMAGQPIAAILDVLQARMRQAGLTPTDEGLRTAADAISERSFT